MLDNTYPILFVVMATLSFGLIDWLVLQQNVTDRDLKQHWGYYLSWGVLGAALVMAGLSLIINYPMVNQSNVNTLRMVTTFNWPNVGMTSLWVIILGVALASLLRQRTAQNPHIHHQNIFWGYDLVIAIVILLVIVLLISNTMVEIRLQNDDAIRQIITGPAFW